MLQTGHERVRRIRQAEARVPLSRPLMPETTPGPPISLAQTWADQADLEGLFQSRRPAHRDRVYPPNDNYGFGPCLRRFAGIAPEESIHAIVPHGHNYPLIDGRRQAPEQERIDAIPTVLASSDACLEAFRNAGGKRVIPIGLASLYAIHCLEPAEQPPAGSLFFRCHSTGVTQLKLDDDQLIRNLRGLPDRFHPIRICAYWRDWDLGEYEPFLAEGFQVVGAGSHCDPLFIWRHLHLLRSHRYVLSTGVSSHVFHACLLEIPTLILPMPVQRVIRYQNFAWKVQTYQEMHALRSHFQVERSEPSRDQRALSELFLGSSHQRSPSELKQILNSLRPQASSRTL